MHYCLIYTTECTPCMQCTEPDYSLSYGCPWNELGIHDLCILMDPFDLKCEIATFTVMHIDVELYS